MRNRIASLLGLSCLLASTFCGHAASAATIRVATTEDLVAAFVAASSASAPTTIRVAAGRYVFTGPVDTGYGPTVLPPVTNSVTVIGQGSENTVLDAERFGRVFTVIHGGRLKVRNLAIENGLVTCDGAGCASIGGGGAAANYGGFLSLEGCLLSGNQTYEINGESAVRGGAVLNQQGELQITATTLSDNRASGGGGAFALSAGSAVIRTSSFLSNTAVNGGAIAQYGGNVVVRSSTIRGNVTFPPEGNEGFLRGGGIAVLRGEFVLVGSTVSGNQAGNETDDFTGFGGGIANLLGKVLILNSAVIENLTLPFGQGGGIHNGIDSSSSQAQMQIQNSTIGGNVSRSAGGGIFNESRLLLENVTIARNQALGHVDSLIGPCTHRCDKGGGGVWNASGGTVTMSRSLISHNYINRDYADAVGTDCQGTVISKGRNAVGVSADCNLQASPSLGGRPTRDQTDLDTRIGQLVDSGKPGNGHFKPLPNSPLIDAAGLANSCSKRDQLWRLRRDGDNDGKIECDVGSVEY